MWEAFSWRARRANRCGGVTDIGFDPAWSPDGKQIAFATEEIGEPASRLGESTLYIVDDRPAARRERSSTAMPCSRRCRRRASASSTGATPADSATSTRSHAAGGTAVAVTNDAAIDWSPVWSPDGRFIYFSSDRGGAMNLWRIAVDAVERNDRPARRAGHLRGAGVRGHAAVLEGRLASGRSDRASPPINPVAIPFDPVTLRAGAPALLDTQNNIRVPSDVSPDGKQIAYFSIGERQEDIFVGPPAGTMRRITDDAPRDRGAVFTPDGRSLIFYSNREGKWGAWTIGVDGGGLRKIVMPRQAGPCIRLSHRKVTRSFSSAMTVARPFTAPVSSAVSGATHTTAR